MGALGLECRGRRPQGKGCLLLAVAGATSLVTLLLAVPITVLAVLALVPQEQGGLVTGTADPGAQAQAHQRFESGELPVEEEAETDLSPRLPAAHLIGAWTRGQGLGWEAKKEEAFLRSGTQFSGAEGLALPQDGLYYLYCHVGYRGRAPPPGGDPLDRSVTLLSRLYRAGGAYGSGSPELLLEGAETVTPVLDPARRHEYGPLWYTSVGFGGLVQLRRGERVYVNISHPDMVDYRRGKTFFGAVMVG
ncbi:lymphotoxin-beta isoform X1 [Balaenoptera ricei]|uniref:Lymphotoxin-beta n=1 Tax=Balaenoptera musculus TaxID=9771 RepID=A0A8B8YTG2_BALMU|nr:lymphotoxin-beta isoform X1 [Balaenoptera musculus]XP_059796709.1 lymphotoxin-beta isoform X1 [Balaenoptera ricei]XP_061050914.1 lymphotoxin-beta isoform X3 [Eubalaena glacialis]